MQMAKIQFILLIGDRFICFFKLLSSVRKPTSNLTYKKQTPNKHTNIVLVCQGWSPDHCPPEQLQQFAVSGLQRVESSVIDEINYDV